MAAVAPGGRTGTGTESGSQPQDLAVLPELDEELLLETLLSRFREQKIYTYIGDILIAINPFRTLPLYEKEVSEIYKNQDKGLLPPHIYAVAARTYEAMRGLWASGPQNQCIVISGESGSGKTESTKLLLRQIMELCRGNSQLEQQILQVNPLLEAFGNAQTVINDNSSRFGKYIQLRFSDSTVKGAKINEYLLEKSRVSRQDDGERNFHIFYYMFAGMSVADKEMFGILEPALYRYINRRYGDAEQAAFWKEKYHGVCNAMDMVGFQEQEQVDMQTILAGILSLGNVVFEPQETGGVTVALRSQGWLKAVAGQFGVQEVELLKCLVCTVSVTRGESIQRLHTQQQAEDARDSIARMVYGRIFGWTVRKINELLAPTVLPEVELTEIGILDIFGFENFAVNHFEQLCINLANEQLQYFFNHHIFLMEQQTYELEGISWDTVTFNNNKAILDLFLAKPMGILSLLDEQSAFPRATDATFVEKLNSHFKGHKNYEMWRSRAPAFTIVHYAGKVQYSGSGFLEKNRDALPGSLRTLFINSITPLLSVLFTATVSRTGTLVPHQKDRIIHVDDEKFKTNRKQSVGAQFRHSLVVLMEKMYSANPHFIRCIKPNGCKQPDVVDRKMILDQLRYNGLLETIRIRRDGFSWRPSFEDFAKRFGILLLKPDLPLSMESCLSILHSTDLRDWKCGKSCLLFKYCHQEQLLKLVKRLDAAAVIIQKYYKAFQSRRKYQALLKELRDQEQKDQQVQEQKEETENKGNRPLPAPVPVPRRRLPQARILSLEPSSQPPVPRPRSKLIMLTPFDNALTSERESPQGETERRQSRRRATLRWFRETQVRKVIADGNFPTWLHGMISRREAEDLLLEKPRGCFLIRISQTREGYTLTYRGQNCCRNYMINMQSNGRYVILGEDRAHISLTNLVEYHKTVGIKPYMETLTEHCGQKSEWEPDYEELKFLTKTLSLENEDHSETSMNSDDQKSVSVTMAELFMPPESTNAQETQLAPSLKRIKAKIKKNNTEMGTERALPRLYPSIRLAMRAIQNVEEVSYHSSVHSVSPEKDPHKQ